MDMHINSLENIVYKLLANYIFWELKRFAVWLAAFKPPKVFIIPKLTKVFTALIYRT